MYIGIAYSDRQSLRLRIRWDITSAYDSVAFGEGNMVVHDATISWENRPRSSLRPRTTEANRTPDRLQRRKPAPADLDWIGFLPEQYRSTVRVELVPRTFGRWRPTPTAFAYTTLAVGNPKNL